MYLVFTTAEEVGANGGIHAARTLPEGVTIAVEVGPTEKEYTTSIHRGPIISYSDALTVYDKPTADRLVDIAAQHNLSPQAAVLGAFESDASHAKALGICPRSALLCLPTLSTQVTRSSPPTPSPTPHECWWVSCPPMTCVDRTIDSAACGYPPTVTLASPRIEPLLPLPRGPLSLAVIELLSERAPVNHLSRVEASLADTDPNGLDLHLALYTCYELHYRGFDGVDPGWEWDASLLHLRGRLESLFLDEVRRAVGPIGVDETATAEMDRLAIEPVDGDGLSYFLRDKGSWEQMREYFVHRSLYHLKEGDPHAWAIPRLIGQAKAAFVAVEYDEFGAGSGSRLHQRLFADLMDAADLNSSYLAYIDVVPAEALAAVNLMSLFGLHRRHRGAAVGHFASTEITSPPGSRRLVEALQRLGAPQACVGFYAEHVEADAVHEQVVRTDVVGDLLMHEPHLDHDVVFGIRAHALVEDRLADHMMRSWDQDRTSLRRSLD